jgi:Uma2 family endonuclease
MASTTHLMTAEELIKLPGGQYRYELVKGELLTMSPSGATHGAVTVNLTLPIATYIKANGLGTVFAAETGFILTRDPDTVLAPDISFIRKDRLGPLSSGYLEIAPDLAVEVISTTKTMSKVEKKTAQWLSFGVRSVWMVNCQNRTVEIVSASGSRHLFSEPAELVDDEVLPGFRVPVSEIFT